MSLKIRPQILFYIALGVSIFITAAICLETFYPSIKKWQSLKKEASLKEGELQRRYETIKEIQRLKQDIPAIERTYADFQKKFFARQDISQAINEIAEISKDLHIEYASVRPLEASKLGEVSFGKHNQLWSVPISIKIKTDYVKLIDFINRLENGQKFMKVENLSIKRNSSDLVAHDIEMSVYVFSLQ